jgi:hypothetical protein
MVRLTKQVKNVDVSLRIVWVPEGAAETGATKGAPAWISVPKEMPAYGTKAFKDMRLDLHLRRSLLQRSSHDRIAIAIAHELSHVVLDSIHHPLRGCEKAVDLTAMLLGFRAIIFCASSGVCAQNRHGRLPSTSKVFSLARTCPTSKQKRRPQRGPPTFAHRVILVSDTTSRRYAPPARVGTHTPWRPSRIDVFSRVHDATICTGHRPNNRLLPAKNTARNCASSRVQKCGQHAPCVGCPIFAPSWGGQITPENDRQSVHVRKMKLRKRDHKNVEA